MANKFFQRVVLAAAVLSILTNEVFAQVKVRPSHSKEANSLYDAGVRSLSAGNLDKAISDFTSAAKHDPEFAGAYYNRGIAWGAKGDNVEAIRSFDAAINADPKMYAAYSARANARVTTHDWEGARADAKKALSLYPDDANASTALGRVEWHNERYKEAIAEMKHAVKLSPNEPLPNSLLATFLTTCPKSDLRNGKQALKFAEAACKSSNWKMPGGLFSLAAAYAETGQFERAQQYQKQGLQLYREQLIKQGLEEYIDTDKDFRFQKESLVAYERKKSLAKLAEEPVSSSDALNRLFEDAKSDLKAKERE